MARFDSIAPRTGSDGRFRAIFERASDALIVFDDSGRCVEANAAAAELIGLPAPALIGQSIDQFIALPPDDSCCSGAALWRGVVEPGHQFHECEIVRPDGSRACASCQISLQFSPGLNLWQMRDITERKQVEHSYRTLVETTTTGYAITDPAGRIVDANAEYVRLSGHAHVEQILGRSPLEWTVPADRARNAAELAACVAGAPIRNLEIDYFDAGGGVQPVEISASAIDTPAGIRVLALVRDITERRRHEEDLRAVHEALEVRVRERTRELAHANAQIRARSQRQEVVASFGHHALMGASSDALMREAVELVGRTLDVELCEVLEWKPSPAHDPAVHDDLLLRAGFGWPAEWLDRRVARSGGHSLESWVLRAHAPIVFEDLATEERFPVPDRLRELGVASGISLVIDGGARPFGLLGAHARQRRAFSGDDVFFVRSMANVLAEAIERQHAEEGIRRAQRDATRANAAKNEFLSRMSHELRTPLNAILGFSQLLEIEDLPLGQRESVDQISRAGRHLLEMVNEVLDIARIESGNLALSAEAVSLRQLVRESVDLLRPQADERGITIDLPTALGESSPYVLADRQRLRQVMIHLLSNAIKYNREKGQVNLSLAAGATQDRVRLEVTDTGVGIPPDKAPRVFTPFERLGAEDTEVEGNGIGLALSKRLMEAQGGELGFESRPTGGSTFWIDLPSAEEPDLEDLPMELLNNLLEDSKTDGAPEAKDQPQTVLHIEDNESNRLLVELLFVQRPSLHLLSAARGQEGLQLARDRHPDLILLDMHLPDTPGEEVLQSLRADARTKGTPVVVISADASGPRIRHLREAGADDYLTKPFNVGQFLRMLDEHLVPAS